MTDEEKANVNEKDEFLEAVKKSFQAFINSGSRSNAKLKPLHGKIAELIKLELEAQIGEDIFQIKSLDEVDEKHKEGKIKGHYYDKRVDILVGEGKKRKKRDIAGYAVKFVMQNYLQNSNNYFENMLGETANIRYGSIPYFQIFIIFSKVPYYNKDNDITHFEEILKKAEDKKKIALGKYIELSKDNTGMCFHTPDLTLIDVIDVEPDPESLKIKSKNDYIKKYNESDIRLKYSKQPDEIKFGDIVEYNNMAEFIERSVAIIKGKYKFK